jgi:hypothetical protein
MVTQAEIEAYVEEMRRAADGAGEWPERWERLRKRLAPPVPEPQALGNRLRRAYEEATGTGLGCE